MLPVDAPTVLFQASVANATGMAVLFSAAVLLPLGLALMAIPIVVTRIASPWDFAIRRLGVSPGKREQLLTRLQTLSIFSPAMNE